MAENKLTQGRLGIYLPEPTIKRLKMLGVESDKPVNTLINEALTFWWKAHHEAERGALFPKEVESRAKAKTETPVVTPNEASPAK